MSGDNKPRTIKLFCPSASKLVSLVAWEGQKLDLGSIARAFGLEPSSVKLNGHFISRGVDLVSSSVTWRSLLSFFSSKGLSTGTDDKPALIVDGKLLKVGAKRAHEAQDGVNGNHQHINGKPGMKEVGIAAKPQLEDDGHCFKTKKMRDGHCFKTKKMRNGSSGLSDGSGPVSKWDGLGFKRKSFMEDVSLFKKLKINETNSGFFGGGNNKFSNGPSKCSYLNGSLKRTREDEIIAAGRCSYLNGSLKRTREDEVIAAASCKRLNSGCS